MVKLHIVLLGASLQNHCMRLKIKCQFGMPRGRPPFKVKVDFNHPLDYLDNIKSLCKSEKMKANVILFATALLGLPELEYEPGKIMNIIHERTPA